MRQNTVLRTAAEWVQLLEAAGGPCGPINLSGSPVTYRHAPPTLGQHTEEVLKEWLAALKS